MGGKKPDQNCMLCSNVSFLCLYNSNSGSLVILVCKVTNSLCLFLCYIRTSRLVILSFSFSLSCFSLSVSLPLLFPSICVLSWRPGQKFSFSTFLIICGKWNTFHPFGWTKYWTEIRYTLRQWTVSFLFFCKLHYGYWSLSWFPNITSRLHCLSIQLLRLLNLSVYFKQM